MHSTNKIPFALLAVRLVEDHFYAPNGLSSLKRGNNRLLNDVWAVKYFLLIYTIYVIATRGTRERHTVCLVEGGGAKEGKIRHVFINEY